ncbi:MAG: GTPase HflX [Planctomycetia bacterium]
MRLDRQGKPQRGADEAGEKAVLVGLVLEEGPGSRSKAAVGGVTRGWAAAEEPLGELGRLADTAGARVVDRMLQKRSRPDATTFVGKGKAAEIGERVRELGARLVIVDGALSPSQARNLEKATGARVVDRTELILDIFALRASSAMARAQVELAQMQYALPRLKRLWTHLNREVGSGKAGIGVRGPGEKQLETDRRLVRKRIDELRKDVAVLQEHRVRQTHSREGVSSICLVGYTNAGKSTLMRALTGAQVFVQDRLFATLDTTTRAWDVVPGRTVLLSDTVGFIRDLPHQLVASFLSTLEEARFADLLLHVVDAGDPEALEHVAVVEETLASIGAGAVPRLAVLNQVDRLPHRVGLRQLQERLPGSIACSALTGEGVDALRAEVRARITRRDLDLVVEADAGNGRLPAFLRECGEVLDATYGDEVARFRVRLPVKHLAHVQRAGGRVIEGAPPPDEDA